MIVSQCRYENEINLTSYIKKSINIRYLRTCFLSHLEVHCPQESGIQEGKEYTKTNQNRSNGTHEIHFKTIVVIKIRCEGGVRCHARHCNRAIHIMILRNNAPVHSPRHGTNPVVPHPPSGNFLKYTNLINIKQHNTIILKKMY